MSTESVRHTPLKTITTQTALLDAFSVGHPYYQDGETDKAFKNVSEFLTFWGKYDIECNRIVRWDIKDPKEDYSTEAEFVDDLKHGLSNYFGNWESKYGEFHFMAPRKGYLFTHRVLNILPNDMPRLLAFLKPHWEYTQKMWDPLPTIEYVPVDSPQSIFLDKIRVATASCYIPPDVNNPTHSTMVNNLIDTTAVKILGVLDTDYVLLEKPYDDATNLDAGLNIAGLLAESYFDKINN